VPSDTPLLYIYFYLLISRTGACDNYLRHR
jgi:hypothetical protein